MPSRNPRPEVLLFDVNETLLDTAPLKQRVGDLLQDPSAGTLWFTTMLQYSLVLTVSGQYKPFPEIGGAVLQMLARNSDLSLSHDDAMALMAGMKSLAPHRDVEPALDRLRQAGVRMATLTNSSLAGVCDPLSWLARGSRNCRWRPRLTWTSRNSGPWPMR